jgi:hypothetical protein
MKEKDAYVKLFRSILQLGRWMWVGLFEPGLPTATGT